MDWDKSQLEAIRRARLGQDVVITGAAGTGKTTLIGEIARNLDGECHIFAPTGKAAARLKEATGFFACTIHRGLGWDGEQFRNRDRLKKPVIVDESSMIDSWLMARLLERKPPQIILVGDAAQLPPVGRGQPFHDLVALRPDMTCVLDVCHRNSSAIHRAANLIRVGKAPATSEKAGGETWSMRETGAGKTTQETIVSWARKGAIDPMQDIIVSARYGDEDGDGGEINSLNAALLPILNPERPKGETWAIGDRVICCRNFADLDLWNGDLATVDAVDVDGGIWLSLDRDGHQVRCVTEHKRELKHAYCLSVHKAQGSQARRVIVVCLTKHWHMTSRALIYTAVTRAREGCVVVGQMKAFYRGINQEINRETVLQKTLTRS